MLRSLDSGVSAMEQFQNDLDVIGNNIANVNTDGFKAARVNFSDTLNQTITSSNGSVPMQIGLGVTTSSIANNFSQGSISQTGSPTDMAISGDGFFVVNDSVTGASYATRDGSFHLDNSGYLVTSGGLRVQGYSDAALGTRGDLKIDNTGSSSTAPVASFSVDSTGIIKVKLTDGTSFTRGQVLMQNFQNPGALTKSGQNLFSGLANAGGLAQTAASGTNGLGAVVSGSLEMSNVDLAGQLTSLITTQRAYQANARVITTSDDILQEIVNLKH